MPRIFPVRFLQVLIGRKYYIFYKDRDNGFTNGPILSKLLRFMLPVLAAQFLQSTYGAVDLLVCGYFAGAAVSASRRKPAAS